MQLSKMQGLVLLASRYEGVDQRLIEGPVSYTHLDVYKRQVKFVLCNRADYEWAKGILAQKNIADQCPVLFSPVYSQVKPTDLAEWVLADQLPVRMQLQLHKILWGEVAGK